MRTPSRRSHQRPSFQQGSSERGLPSPKRPVAELCGGGSDLQAPCAPVDLKQIPAVLLPPHHQDVAVTPNSQSLAGSPLAGASRSDTPIPAPRAGAQGAWRPRSWHGRAGLLTKTPAPWPQTSAGTNPLPDARRMCDPNRRAGVTGAIDWLASDRLASRGRQNIAVNQTVSAQRFLAPAAGTERCV
jgi:hypothetical protein